MKKLLFAALCLLLSCTKTSVTPEPKTTVLVYSTNGYSYLHNIPVYIDGVSVGRLKYSVTPPYCNDTGYVIYSAASGVVKKIEIPSTSGTAGTIKYVATGSNQCQPEIINP